LAEEGGSKMFDPSVIGSAAAVGLGGVLFGLKRMKKAPTKNTRTGTGKHICAYSKCDNQVPSQPFIQFFCSKRCRFLARSKRGERIVKRMEK